MMNLSILTVILQVQLSRPVLLELMMMEVVLTTGDMSRAKCFSHIVTTNKPTHNFMQIICPSCGPTNSVRALKGNVTFHGLA